MKQHLKSLIENPFLPICKCVDQRNDWQNKARLFELHKPIHVLKDYTIQQCILRKCSILFSAFREFALMAADMKDKRRYQLPETHLVGMKLKRVLLCLNDFKII